MAERGEIGWGEALRKRESPREKDPRKKRPNGGQLTVRE